MSKQIKITYGLFIASIVCAIAHNAFSALWQIEEPVFFTLTFVCLLGFVAMALYSLFTYKKKGEPRDLWKLGWLGLLGLIGLWPRFGAGLAQAFTDFLASSDFLE